MNELRDKVLKALKSGRPMKKAEVMEGAKLSAHDSARVTNILAKLKADKLVKMQGVRGAATYTLR